MCLTGLIGASEVLRGAMGHLRGALVVPEICLVPSEVPQRCLRCALEVPETCPRETCLRGTLEVPEGRLGGAQQVP